MKQEVKEILDRLIERLPELHGIRSNLEEAFELLNRCYKQGNKVMVCGNGGSAADSEHIVGELMKGFLLKRPLRTEDAEKISSVFPEDAHYLIHNLQGALQAISLVSQSALSSAFINDVAPDMVFAQQVYGYAETGDVLIGLSTSGNSKNVVNALKIARAFGMKTIGMTGDDGGQMKHVCDIVLRVPSSETFRIQEYHLPIYHALCAMLELEFFSC